MCYTVGHDDRKGGEYDLTIIYIDILLALNLFVDFLLIAATAKVLQRPARRSRHILGAIVGALSSLIILAPPLSPLLTLLYQTASALCMVIVAFPIGSFGKFLKTMVVLLVISAAFSGICTIGYQLLSPVGLLVQSGVVYYNLSPLLLIAMTTVSYGLLSLFDRFTRKRVALGYAYRIEIIDGGHRLILRALLDTGHSLQDSFSGAPVILVSETAVRPLRDRYDITSPNGLCSGRIRYIPYSCIGGDGVLAAFRPERVILHADTRQQDISGVWIAAITSLGRGEYEALIGPSVADLITVRAHFAV